MMIIVKGYVLPVFYLISHHNCLKTRGTWLLAMERVTAKAPPKKL